MLCLCLSNAIGSEADLKMYRDKGVVGEKKTLQEGKFYYEPTTGSTFHFPKKGTFVTPQVNGNVAYFDLNGMYNFRFECLNWRYSIAAHWSSPNVAEERDGFSVSLESPDRVTFIETKEVDILVTGTLSTSITQEQLNAIQSKGYTEDPFVGEERILAAQQAVKWILDNGLDNYEVMSGMPINFGSENIGNKLFVKATVDVFSKKDNLTKKCTIWALNCRSYRFKKSNERWTETWICQLISDPIGYPSTVAKTHTILETLKFNPGRNIYPDLIN